MYIMWEIRSSNELLKFCKTKYAKRLKSTALIYMFVPKYFAGNCFSVDARFRLSFFFERQGGTLKFFIADL